MVLRTKKPRSDRASRAGTARLCASLAALAALAGTGTARAEGGPLTLESARALTQRTATPDDGFPMVVDEVVLTQLNRFVGTADGRAYLREALVRMADYRPMVEAKLKAAGLPVELEALPIVESGYQNLPESANSTGCCSGLWQFRAATARLYGLTVDSQVDERRHAVKATNAALRDLGHQHDLFKDWGLAVAAYNMGENAVQAAIDETGIRDPWKLGEAGKLETYLSTVMAVVILMRNPSLLD